MRNVEIAIFPADSYAIYRYDAQLPMTSGDKCTHAYQTKPTIAMDKSRLGTKKTPIAHTQAA